MNQELQQLKLGDKVKLKLEQPAIKCSGRKDVECYYRAKVQWLHEDSHIELVFKSFGTFVTVLFKDGKCVTPEWYDLKIVS